MPCYRARVLPSRCQHQALRPGSEVCYTVTKYLHILSVHFKCLQPTRCGVSTMFTAVRLVVKLPPRLQPHTNSQAQPPLGCQQSSKNTRPIASQVHTSPHNKLQNWDFDTYCPAQTATSTTSPQPQTALYHHWPAAASLSRLRLAGLHVVPSPHPMMLSPVKPCLQPADPTSVQATAAAAAGQGLGHVCACFNAVICRQATWGLGCGSTQWLLWRGLQGK